MTALLERIDRWIGSAEMGVCVGLLVVIVAVTAAGVFARYVLNSPLVWGADIGLLALVWLTFVGAGALYRRNGHIAASTLPDRLPRPLGTILNGLAVVAVAGSVAVVGWYGVKAAVVQSGQMITTLGIPRSTYSIPIIWAAVSIGVAILVELLRSAEAGRSRRGGD